MVYGKKKVVGNMHEQKCSESFFKTTQNKTMDFKVTLGM
jgi:hypothetical protein